MTDWIDTLAAGLKDDDKRKNIEHAIKLRNYELIEVRAPGFWRSLKDAVKQLSDELNEKLGASLGGVNVAIHDARFSVSSHGKIANVSISGTMDPRSKHIDIQTTRDGTSSFVATRGPEKRTYWFKIDNQDRLIASTDGEWFHDPEQMAEAVLKSAFTKDLFVPY